MFDEKDPILHRVRALCMVLPGAAEKVSHGRPCFYTKKIFLTYGVTLKGDHEGGRKDHAIAFLPDPAERAALEQDERFFVPAYSGAFGWMAMDLSTDDVDWGEVGELIEESFRQTAPPKLCEQLNSTERPSPAKRRR